MAATQTGADEAHGKWQTDFLEERNHDNHRSQMVASRDLWIVDRWCGILCLR